MRWREFRKGFPYFCAVRCVSEGCVSSLSGGRVQALEEVGGREYYDDGDVDSLRSESYLRMDQ